MTSSEQGYHDAAHLRQLADQCDRGVQLLLHDADNAEAVLEERAGFEPGITPQQWAAEKRSAAEATKAYAQGLRDEADALGDGPASAERIAQAEKVAKASELGGILMDPANLTSASLESPWHSAEMRQAILDHDAATRAAVEGSGVFEHVAVPGQAAFWRLSNEATAAAGLTDPQVVGSEAEHAYYWENGGTRPDELGHVAEPDDEAAQRKVLLSCMGDAELDGHLVVNPNDAAAVAQVREERAEWWLQREADADEL